MIAKPGGEADASGSRILDVAGQEGAVSLAVDPSR
jgi:hypothetical protein